MERLERPDGVELAWEARGEGPLVVLVNQFIGVTRLYSVLLDDLARDHRVLVYDPRGTGDSTRRGPYDLDTDLADLEAVVEHGAGSAVLLGVSDGNIRAVRLAEHRPDLVRTVVAMAGSTLGQTPAGSDALAGSGQVLSAFVKLMRADVRTGVRTMMTSGGSAAWEDEVISRRVDESAAYTHSEAAAARLSTWVGDDSTPQALALGDRLTILAFGGNPWFPVDQAERTRRALPEAQVLEVENGPVTRPDITAAIVRRITAGN
jgi:pimeloyl-ACP methyl ester carboxylesterase